MAVLAAASTASAQAVAGLVVDPQDGRVAGAIVTLSCPGENRHSVTDLLGGFTFGRLEKTEGCTLQVTAPGFVSWSQALATNARMPLAVRLELAPILQSVEVRAAPVAASRSAAGLFLTGEQVRTLSNDPRDVISYATALDGSSGQHVVYVDGFPSKELPATASIANIAVDGDPFSAEYSDPGARRIEVTTTQPDRSWRLNLSAAPPTAGAANPLAPGHSSRSRTLGGGLSGPTPWTGGSFSLNAGIDGTRSKPVIVAVVPDGLEPAGAGVWSEDRRRRLSVQFQQKLGDEAGLRFAATRWAQRATGAGIGGEVLAEAGTRRETGNTEVRVEMTRRWATAVLTSQLLGGWRDETMEANLVDAGTWVPGAFIGGGDSVLRSRTNRGTVQSRTVISSPAGVHPWRAGLALDRLSMRSLLTPNPAGHVQFGSLDEWSAAEAGAPVGTFYLTTEPTDQQAVLNSAAVFADTVLRQRTNSVLKGGVRVEWQSRDRVRVSPRLSGTLHLNAWMLSGGAGLFTRDWTPDLFVGTRAASGDAPIQYIARGVSLADVSAADVTASPVQSDVRPGLTRARYLMTSESADRALGQFTVGVAHTWWHGHDLPGTRRLPDAASAGWIDWLESNRSSSSHEVRARFGVGSANRSLVFTYGWVHSADDTDGAFSFPARQDDLAAEWARSARIPSQSVDLVASSSLPLKVRAMVMVAVHGETPYNIVSGLDVEQNGLQTDRGGLSRNSGNGPGYKSVSLYLNRRFDLSALLGPRVRIPLDLGARVENVLGAHNWTTFGNVIGSPLFGQPEGALPGRSLRIWFTLAH
jgi:hypothetical protein